MLAQTDAERKRYEARRTAQLDSKTGLKVARMEGQEKGIAKGRQEGQSEGRIYLIHRYERQLHRQETPTKRLAHLALEELGRLIDAPEDELVK